MFFTEDSGEIDASKDITPQIDVTKNVKIRAIAHNAINDNKPVILFLDENGNVKCQMGETDTTALEGCKPGYWGVVEVGGSIGDVVDVIVHGKAKVTNINNALTPNHQVKSINGAGFIVAQAETDSTTENAYLAVVLSNDTIFIY